MWHEQNYMSIQWKLCFFPTQEKLEKASKGRLVSKLTLEELVEVSLVENARPVSQGYRRGYIKACSHVKACCVHFCVAESHLAGG